MTAFGDVHSVIDAMRAGVLDYLLKPIQIETLLSRLEVIRERRDLRSQVSILRSEMHRVSDPGALLGKSGAIEEIRKILTREKARNLFFCALVRKAKIGDRGKFFLGYNE